MQQQNIRTLHVYFEEEEVPPIEADPTPESEQTTYLTLGLWCGLCISLLCLLVPLWATFLPVTAEHTYDRTITKTLTLELSLHPTPSQVQLYTLPTIIKTEQVTVSATGSIHQNATTATGLITFYNGLFSLQTVPAGTKLTGKDGIAVITSQVATIPAATPTTPPTYGTVSVTGYSAVAGTLGNIAASDINQACCGASLLAQNLYAFSGGQDAKDLPVLTKTDITAGTKTVTDQVHGAISDQAQAATKPGYILLPLTCSQALTANHQPGDQVPTAIITLKESCTPLAYVAGAIATTAKHVFTVPNGYHLVSLTALVLSSTITPTGGTLTVHAIAYLKQDKPTNTAHYAGAK